MPLSKSIRILPASTADDLAEIKKLFRAYVDWLDIDLSYQGFEEELAGLPGKYASPSGALFLARNGKGVVLGCIALRPMEEGRICEIKRLYVSPEARGLGVGSALVGKVITAARQIGYQRARLDTLPTMTGAIKLYRGAGFEEISAYYNTPVKETVFFEMWL